MIFVLDARSNEFPSSEPRRESEKAELPHLERLSFSATGSLLGLEGSIELRPHIGRRCRNRFLPLQTLVLWPVVGEDDAA